MAQIIMVDRLDVAVMLGFTLRHWVRPYTGSGNGLINGHREPEAATLSWFTLHFNPAAVSLNQVFGNGKPQPPATSSPSPRLVHSIKAFEDIGQILRRDTFTGIGHAYLYPAILLPGTHLYAISLSSMGYRILQKV